MSVSTRALRSSEKHVRLMATYLESQARYAKDPIERATWIDAALLIHEAASALDVGADELEVEAMQLPLPLNSTPSLFAPEARQ